MPVHHLHDGPIEPFYVSKFNTKTITRKPHATLAALQWAADRAGQSYGRFTLNLSSADEERIQVEYERFLAARKEEMAAHQTERRPRVDINAGEAGFIITDEDV